MSIHLNSAPSPRPVRNPQAPTVRLGSGDDADAGQSSAPSIWLSPETQTDTGERVGRYPVSGEIARGGMGAILRGHDPNLGRDLAIKVLLDAGRDPEQVRRFVEEAQIGGQLQHPGIVPVYEIGHYADNRPYFTMKLVEGRTLFHLLWERSDPAHDCPRFLGIFQQVCLTIAYAHDHGVIHRDLKPGNIMVGSFGEVLVMDWGLAKVLNRAGQAPDPAPTPCDRDIRTVRTEVEGPLRRWGPSRELRRTWPPEQARGENERVDKRADVFALGSILCEILTGQPAYDSTKTDEHLFPGFDGRSWRLPGESRRLRRRSATAPTGPPLSGIGAGCPATRCRHRRHGNHRVPRRGCRERLRQAELERAAAQGAVGSGETLPTAQGHARRSAGGADDVWRGAGGFLVAGEAGGCGTRSKAISRGAEQAEANGQLDGGAAAAAERAGGRQARRLRTGRSSSAASSRVRDDLDMQAQLDQIRLKQADITDGHFNRADAVAEYAAAFRRSSDLDVLTLDTGEGGKARVASAIAEPLLAAAGRLATVARPR